VNQRAECCGIVGGNRLDFIKHYAQMGIRLIEEPGNQAGWASFDDKEGHNILFEQYLLAACLEYHRAAPDSPYRDVSISYLFDHYSDAYDEEQAKRVGFTHLMAAKRDRELGCRLKKRVLRDYPHYYERCRKYAQSMGSQVWSLTNE
jgi:hypothetical protein